MVVLTVIIVSYNVKYYLQKCLDSVYTAGKNINLEVIVVDNCSADGTREYLEPLFPGVKFFWNHENKGFAKACNQGLQTAAGDCILFLNPDTVVEEDCFVKCLGFFEAHPDAGAVGVRMINGSGRFLRESKRAFPHPFTALMKLTGLARLFPRSAVFARYYLGHLDEMQTHEVDVIAGAFMMMKKEIATRTGGFDEDFFMYGEDIDLSYRIRELGCKNYYYPGVTILHFKGKSTPQKDRRYIYIFYNAMHIFVNKHYKQQWGGGYRLLLQSALWCRAAVDILWLRAAQVFRHFTGK